MAGRPRKPVSQLEGHLTKEQIRQREEQEEMLKQLPKDKIKPPAWLSVRGKKIFRDIVNNLEEVDILANVDIYNLGILAEGLDNFIEVTIQLDARRFDKGTGGKKFTTTHINKFGAENEVEDPLINIQIKYSKMVKEYSMLVGLNPAARLKLIQAHSEGDLDDFDRDFK